MFKSKTVFVVGAGASKEANMPLGEGLLSSIADRVFDLRENGFRNIDGLHLQQALIDAGADIKRLSHMFEGVGIGMKIAFSIDNFIQARSHDPDVLILGKMLIAEAIMKAEAQSLLMGIDSGNNAIYDSKNWYRKFFNLLVSEINVNNLSDIFNNVSFISFNYDRCVKHYLYNALIKYYGIAEQHAAITMENLDVIHPYGSLGRLPWEMQGIDEHKQNFGAENVGLLNVYNQIYTFDESIDNIDGVKSAINFKLQSADKIIFLGFAYYEQNMKLMSEYIKRKRPIVYGTAYNIAAPAQKNFRHIIETTFGSNGTPNLDHVTCSDLFHQFDGLLN